MIVLYYCFLLFFLSQSFPSTALYSITSLQPLFWNETLLSSSQYFELGFFTPNGSSNQYVGMWYKNFTPSKVVWVASRDFPLPSKDQLASLTIGGDGNLRILDGLRNVVWSTDVSAKSNGSTAVLLDTGNLVLRDVESGNILWESFDHPTDTILPGMNLGINVKTGEKRYVVSWKSDSDPSPGKFTMGMTPEVPPQPFIWNGSAPHWRGGQWDKSKFIGIPDMDTTYLSGYKVEQDTQLGTTYFSFSTNGDFYYEYLFVSSKGSCELVDWDDAVGEWHNGWGAPRDPCEMYGTCGPFSVCNASSSPICKCLDGFTPKSEEEWETGIWTGGCRRKKELRCRTDPNTGASLASKTNETDRFLNLSQMKLPDASFYVLLDAEDCPVWCLNNCSCTAYSYVDTIGCMIWFNELMDIQSFNMSGEDLFVRLSYEERENVKENDRNNTTKIIIALTVIFAIIVLGAVIYIRYRRRASKTGSQASTTADAPSDVLLRKIRNEEEQDLSSEIPMFSFKSILAATGNFTIRNKLGQGGFGPVYKGLLQDGKEVAVKRLSSCSGQGMEEFKNEIVLISKLQHRNLVKLLGCCIEGEERILIYEYLPNKSLDTLLFDPRRKGELTWEKRLDIIQGIAKGLMYLHRDSCLRIIHRDLKASNILLDEKMNPKISDFGLARNFQATQDLVNTHRVVGTLGYMSPEYAMGGTFSEKSDVYSFGVLMLEIISGKRNSSLCYLGKTLNLLSYAWQLWKEGRAVEFLDEVILADSVTSRLEVVKCISIGLLCIQDQAMDRPNMPSVVLILSGESDLPEPKPPTLTSFQGPSDHEIHSQHEDTLSINTITQTAMEGR